MSSAHRSAFVVPRSSFRVHRFSFRPSSLVPRPYFCCLLLSALCLLPSSARAGAWAQQRSGTMAWLRAVHFVDERAGWAVGGNGALLSTADGGADWKVRARLTPDTLRDVFFTDASNGWLVCERSVYALARAEEPRSYLMRTTDGGETWSRVALTADDAGVLLSRVVFADAERGWAFGEMGALYSTRDGGATWQRQRAPTQRLLLGASFLDASRGWLVGAAGTVLRTEDGGATWRPAAVVWPAHAAVNASASAPAVPPQRAAAPRLSAASFVDARRGWAVGAGGFVAATADGGRTWAAQDSGTDADLADVKFTDAREGWAVGASGTVLRTADGGATWQQVSSGTRHHLERLSFAGGARGWAVGFGGTIIAYGPAPAAAPRLSRPHR
ncbi:MAG: hypothetical protein LC800_02815 [Acidobacteria bacterium]|nr:hypothetical protein [Acidobacteriota bacterium]